MKNIISKWWPYLATFTGLLVYVIISLFFPTGIYIDIWVYILLIPALLFAIISIFIWGGEDK
jgi:hypothetical protein